MIRREQLRLTATFRKLLLLSLAAPAGAAAYACGSSSSSDDTADSPDSGNDATTMADAITSGDDQSTDAAAADASANDGASACQPGAGYYNDASWVADVYADGAPAICQYFVDFPCDPEYMTAPAPTNCVLYLHNCTDICMLDAGFVDCQYAEGAGCSDGSLDPAPRGAITIACGLCSGVGRRPAGLRGARRAKSSTAIGAYFADAAHLEAASVHAFERLRDELRSQGAPDELVRTAERSILDEVRHARVMTRLARRFGCEPAVVRMREPRARSLEAIALENVVEGCVRETFGAMVATWQAANATDASIRAHMRRIAHDETRHAALAWSVARWAEERLDSRARSRVLRARRKAVRELRNDLASNLPESSATAAGLPNERDARAIFDELARSIWS